MPTTATNGTFDFTGTTNDDTLIDGQQTTSDTKTSETSDINISVNGLEGNDTLMTGHGNNLAAGDMVGTEWSFIDGRWVYNESNLVQSTYGSEYSFDDFIQTGRGDDILLGNGGDDTLLSGSGADILNAGRGDDRAFAGHGDDIVNLEAGNDYAEAGFGDDIVNGGSGNDVIYGDLRDANLLKTTNNATTLSQLSQSTAWTITDSNGEETISQSAETVIGETYTISFDLAANLAGGHSTGMVEVLWNDAVVSTVEATSGAYQTFTVDVLSEGEAGELSFRALTPEDSNTYNFDGPIITYEKEMEVDGESTTVQAFAAGQAKLYQVIDGQLNVFDVETKSYVSVGDKPSFKTNAVGFNVEDDLIYGVAKSDGTDSIGNAVSVSDIVMIDAAGDTFRIGEGFYGDYVGDFDDSGNLWTFHSGLNRVSVVDVDALDADGNPEISHFKFPNNMFTDRTYDLSFNAADQSFYAVISPNQNGGDGKVVKIDLSTVADGGTPTFSEIAITGTLYGDGMNDGMAKGAFGATFLDGEGNLYFGLNNGDHDLDASTGTKGAIFKVNMDWDAGYAFAEFMSETPSTSSNDGAVDPRSVDAFSEIDADATVLLREPTLTVVDGGNDILRGGEGNDEIHGNEGADKLLGGAGEDELFGDQGNDKISGGKGDDTAVGGIGDDKLRGEAGNDTLFGGAGEDYLSGGNGNDILEGDAGVDKLIGGEGNDTIEGGAGNDHLWGGQWKGDEAADTFVFNSGTGKDYVHDFEVGHDIIDVSGFDTNMDAIKNATTDLGWATVIDLQQLDGGQIEDRIVLKSVDAETLSFEDFIF